MSVGVDTSWLLQIELREHASHDEARAMLNRLAEQNEKFALAPQVLDEFVHAATDGKRFRIPLSMSDAIDAAENWWNAKSAQHIFPTADSVRLGWQWMRQFRLGRKRILDTQLAATFHTHGILRILTSNVRDYQVFGCFELL